MRCPNCAYDLRGQTRDESNQFRCPECGELSAGTASRGEVIAAYRSWRGSFGGGLHTLGAQFLDSPAIMRTVGWRYLFLLASCFVIPAVLLVGSCFVVTSKYERWWSPIDQPATKIDVDSVEIERRFIFDPNDGVVSAAMPNGVRNDRYYHTKLTARALRFELPGLRRTERAMTLLLASAIRVSAPLLVSIFLCRVLLALSPDMPTGGNFRRAIGMTGCIIVPMMVQFWVFGIAALISLVGSAQYPLRTTIWFAPVCWVLGMLWTGMLLAMMPWMTMPSRDRAMCLVCGIMMLVAYWTPAALLLMR